jgi:hypothetical protein
MSCVTMGTVELPSYSAGFSGRATHGNAAGNGFPAAFCSQKKQSMAHCDLFFDLHPDGTRRVFTFVKCCGAIE